MNAKRHANLTAILQFISIVIFFLLFFSSIDFLQAHDIFSPALFILGPILPLVAVRLLMIHCFPPPCPSQGCDGQLLLHHSRNRRYNCNVCGQTIKLKKPQHQDGYQRRIYRLLGILGLIVVGFVGFAMVGIFTG